MNTKKSTRKNNIKIIENDYTEDQLDKMMDELNRRTIPVVAKLTQVIKKVKKIIQKELTPEELNELEAEFANVGKPPVKKQEKTVYMNVDIYVEEAFYEEHNKVKKHKNNYKTEKSDHGTRFTYMTYYDNVPVSEKVSQYWQMGQFYSKYDKDGIADMMTMQKLIEDSSNDNKDALAQYLQSYQIDGFKITSMIVVDNPNKKVNVLGDKLMNDDTGKMINSKYTQYKLNLQAEKFSDLLELNYNKYIQLNYRPMSCMLTCIINAFYDRFNRIKSDGKRANKELTYAYLCEILEIEDKPTHNAVDILTCVDKFFKRFNFASLYVYSPFMELIYEHKASTKSDVCSLRVMIKDKHVYQLNNNLKSLEQKINYDDDERTDLKPSDKYRVLTKPQEDIMCESKQQIFRVIQECKETKEVRNVKIVTCFELSELNTDLKAENPVLITKSRKNYKIQIKAKDGKYKIDIIKGLPRTIEIFATSVDEVMSSVVNNLKVKNVEYIKIITNADMNSVLIELMKNKYTPKMYFNAFLFKISFIIDMIMISIETCDDNPIYGRRISFDSLEEYKQFTNAYEAIYRQMIKKEYVSDYHESVQLINNTYPIRPLLGHFEGASLSKLYDTTDENKAYTECVMNIKQIPVFHYFDVYKKYENQPIEDESYYMIEVLENTEKAMILFDGKFSRTKGFILKNTDVKHRVLSYMNPLKIEDVNFQAPIDELYAKQIPTDFKKMIVNKITGMMELKYNKNHLSKYFEDVNEAEVYRIKYEGKIMPLITRTVYEVMQEDEFDGGMVAGVETYDKLHGYLVNVSSEQELCQGLAPIKDNIYLMQRLKMFKLYEKMKANKIEVYGFKTDCIYNNAGQRKLQSTGIPLNKEIGGFKVEHDKYLPSRKLEITENELIDFPDFTVGNVKEFEDEKDTQTINKYLSDKKAVLVKGLYPGVGKSTLCKNFDKNSLFILPYNKLCQELKKDGFNAITFSKAFGLYANDLEVGIKQFDLSQYSTIVFDEAFLYTPDRLKRMSKLIKANPEKKFFATGDTNQRNPIGFDNSEYLEHCMNILFPNQILLKDIKRLVNEADKQKWKQLKKDIFESKMSIEDICKKHGIKIVRSMGDVTTQKNVCYFNFRCGSVNNWIHNTILKNKAQYLEGMEIICRKYEKTSEFVIHTNYTYRIKKIKGSLFTIVDEVDNIEYKLDIKIIQDNFKLPYALTCDSVQGLSFGEDEKVTIFDSNVPYTDRKYFYTAITRARKLDNIQVFIHSDAEVERLSDSKIKQYFRFKCEGYKLQDKKAGRAITDDDFVNENWIHDQLNKCEYKCVHCAKHFEINMDDEGYVHSDVTVDRIDNKKAHFKSNCVMSCLLCNVSKK